jgi:hypothetical protein
VAGAFPEPDQRNVGSLASGHGSDVCDLDLARDYLVPQGRDDRSDQSQAILSLVCDQHAQMLGLAVAHFAAPDADSNSGTAIFETSVRGIARRCKVSGPLRLKPRRATSGSNSWPLWRVDLTEVSAECKR